MNSTAVKTVFILRPEQFGDGTLLPDLRNCIPHRGTGSKSAAIIIRGTPTRQKENRSLQAKRKLRVY